MTIALIRVARSTMTKNVNGKEIEVDECMAIIKEELILLWRKIGNTAAMNLNFGTLR